MTSTTQIDITVSYSILPGGQIAARINKYPECYDTFNNMTEADMTLRHMLYQAIDERGETWYCPVNFIFIEEAYDYESDEPEDE